MGCEMNDGGTVIQQWVVRLEALLHAEGGSTWVPQQLDDEPNDLRSLFKADQGSKCHVPLLARRPVRKPRARPPQQQSENTQDALLDTGFLQQQQQQQQFPLLAGHCTAVLYPEQQPPVQHCRHITEHVDFEQGSGDSCSGSGMGELLQCAPGGGNVLHCGQAMLDPASRLHTCTLANAHDAAAASGNASSSNATDIGPMGPEQQLKAAKQPASAETCCSSSNITDEACPSSTADVGVHSSSIVFELHRLHCGHWGQVAGPVILSITACVLALALMLQLQRAGNSAISTSARFGKTSGGSSSFLNSDMVLRALPGLAAVVVAQLKPLQFLSASLESAYQAHVLGSKQVIDVLLSSSWCLLAMCSAMRSTWGPHTSSGPVDLASQQQLTPFSQSSGGNSLHQGLHTMPDAQHGAWTVLLIAPMLALMWLACMGPRRTYSRCREQLLMVCRFVMVSSGPGIAMSVESRGPLVLLTLVHALVSACTAVRFSSFVPMQLMQVVALLVASQGQSVLYCMQLVAFGLLLPCVVLLHVEVAMRNGFLATQLHGDVKGGSSSGSKGGGCCISKGSDSSSSGNKGGSSCITHECVIDKVLGSATA